MKKILTGVVAILFLIVGTTGALATPVLYDGYIDVNGTISQAAYTYMPPEVGGDITTVTGFTMFTPPGDPYGFEVPEALGTIEVTFQPWAAGDYYVEGFADVEIDEWVNTWFNESGAVNGTASGGVYGEIYNPGPGDVAFVMGWDFSLAADEYAVITFILTDQMPSGFYLSQTDNDTGETVYLYSTLDIEGGVPQVPEPATMLLLGLGLVGLAGIRKRL